jgi:hypothetical protein
VPSDLGAVLAPFVRYFICGINGVGATSVALPREAKASPTRPNSFLLPLGKGGWEGF